MLGKSIVVLLILVVVSIQLPMTGNGTLQGADSNSNAVLRDAPNPAYVSHASIIINSNADFVAQGWPGNGTQGNPFVIEGLSIITDRKECINISHTDAFFVIRSCYISSVHEWEGLYNRGITLGDVANGVIENVDISKKWLAVTITLSSNCSLVQSEIHDNCQAIDIHGFYGKEYPENCTILSNTIYGNHDGIHLDTVSNCRIDRNDIIGDVSLTDTRECTVSSNIINGSQTGRYPFYLSFYETTDVIVINNTMIDSGLEFTYDPILSIQLINNTVNGKPIGYFKNLSNTIIDPDEYGQIILVDCDNVTTQDGAVHNTSVGIGFFSCNSCLIKNCTVYSCGYGATLAKSESCSVILSEFHHNQQWGIAVAESNDTIVTANAIYENRGMGIFVPCISGIGNAFFRNVICANGEDSMLTDGNSWDDGQQSTWDDGLSHGNYWDDYGGTGEYHIPGDCGSVDRYPSRVSPIGDTSLRIGFSVTPFMPSYNDTIDVAIGVIDTDGVEEVILSYSTDGNLTWNNLTMSHYGPIWNATIPPQNGTMTISYRAFVRDRLGNTGVSDIQCIQCGAVTNTQTEGEYEILILLATAIGGTIVFMGLALVLSRKR